VLGVGGGQPVVEQLAGDGVEAEIGLVEERERHPGRQADGDADGGDHAAGELADPAPGGQVEVGHQRAGQVLVPGGNSVTAAARTSRTRKCSG
jgi:hypothetical protein